MIYVRYDKPKNQARTDYSAYLSFQYNPFYVEEIKKLPCRYYFAERKEWEIPTDLLPDVRKFEPDITELNQLPYYEEEINDLVFKTPSYPYQIEGVKYGIERKNWLLGDQQGLGKTKQMIDLAVWKKKHRGLKHVLVICGVNNLKYNWIDEIHKHSDEEGKVLGFTKKGKEPSMKDRLEDLKSIPEEFFWITNIESLRCHKEGRYYVSELVDVINQHITNGELGLVIVDEIHKAKNPTSMQGRGLTKIKGCDKIGLSGTLLVNKPLDLYTPLYFIGAISYNYYTFVNRYCEKDLMWGKVIGYKNMSELRDLMSHNMLRRTKDLLDLPPKIRTEVPIEMSKNERKLYEEIINAAKQECDKIRNPMDKLSKLVRARQVCCHTSLVSSKFSESSKFQQLRDDLEEARANGDKVVVFCRLREVLELAEKEFAEFNPLHIWGQMKPEELAETKRIFQEGEDFNVLFGQIDSAGTGHTLTRAQTVIFLDPPWNMATAEQAEDRCHRIGTRGSVNVRYYLMNDSYDEKWYKMVLQKGDLSEALVDGKDPKTISAFISALFSKEG